MIWETNGRYFQRDESGTKRISEARYKEFEDEEEEFEIDFEEEDYEPTPGPPPEKISPEIYDALEDFGAASIPDNNYSLSEIKALAQRLNQLLGREKC